MQFTKILLTNYMESVMNPLNSILIVMVWLALIALAYRVGTWMVTRTKHQAKFKQNN